MRYVGTSPCTASPFLEALGLIGAVCGATICTVGATITAGLSVSERLFLLWCPPRCFVRASSSGAEVPSSVPPPLPPYRTVAIPCLRVSEKSISAAYGGQGDWENAAADASTSVKLNPQYAKGEGVRRHNPRHHRDRGSPLKLFSGILKIGGDQGEILGLELVFVL